MLLFVISCFSFVLLSKYSTSKLIPSLKFENVLLSFQWGFRKLVRTSKLATTSMFDFTFLTSREMGVSSSRKENAGENVDVSLLDLPDLPLECILERLSPAGLCKMAGVCRSFRDFCTSDHLWERHLQQKWGKLMGDSAYREWQGIVASAKGQKVLSLPKKKWYFWDLTSAFWPRKSDDRSWLPVDSVMALYVSLEGGKFCFPAQVYNRENGHAGFMLSCYDAKVIFDSSTDTFKARYSALGRPIIEENVEWNRLRAPLVDTSPYTIHVSECLNDLHPGNHVEIQWRKNKEFPYGWWYGVVGHLGSCDRSELYCQCFHSDTVILEFKQYAPGSKWREVSINRKDHREVGNEEDGFYAGIRKLYREEEMSKWKNFWPTQILE